MDIHIENKPTLCGRSPHVQGVGGEGCGQDFAGGITYFKNSLLPALSFPLLLVLPGLADARPFQGAFSLYIQCLICLDVFWENGI